MVIGNNVMTPKPCLKLRLSADVSFVESTVVIVAAVTVWIYLGCIYTWNIALILSLFLELINRVNFQIINYSHFQSKKEQNF